MNLSELYGPTMTLKQLCQVFKISRTSYYNYSEKKQFNAQYKPDFPKPLPSHRKLIFVTSIVEDYIRKLQVEI